MSKEEWRSVVGYEGSYEVSNLGKVRSISRKRCGKNGSVRLIKGVMLSHGINRDGYPVVVLYKDGKKHTRFVHRLVAQAFLKNPLNKPQVNHIDEDKLNNKVDNLEFVTIKENANHGTKTERQAAHCRKPVKATDIYNGESFVFDGVNVAARAFGFNRGAISTCCNNKIKQYKGFRWEFI